MLVDLLSCLFCITCVRICLSASMTLDAAGDMAWYVGVIRSCCLGMWSPVCNCGSGCGVATGWYISSWNAIPVSGVFWVFAAGYLLQTSVSWLLHWHLVQNTFCCHHLCCLCPCFPHLKHMEDSFLFSVLSVWVSMELWKPVAIAGIVGWLPLRFMYLTSLVAVFWQLATVKNSVFIGLFQWRLCLVVCVLMRLDGAVIFRIMLVTAAAVFVVLCWMGMQCLLRWLVECPLVGVFLLLQCVVWHVGVGDP